MSKFTLNEKSDNGFQDAFIDDVTFLYVCINTAKKKFQSEEKEYSVKCVVDEDTYDAFAEAFPKNVSPKNIVKTSEFESTYKIEAPFPDEKKQYLINIKMQHADVNGVPHPDSSFKRPKVLINDVENEGQVRDVTLETLVGNGSKGSVDFWISSSKYGQFPKLTNIFVSDLVEYEGNADSGGGAARTRHGVVSNAQVDTGASDFSEQAKEDPAPIAETDEF